MQYTWLAHDSKTIENANRTVSPSFLLSAIVNRMYFSWIGNFVPLHLSPISPHVPSHCSKAGHFAQKADERIHTFRSNHPAPTSPPHRLFLLLPSNPRHFAKILCAPQIKWQHLDEIDPLPYHTVQIVRPRVESNPTKVTSFSRPDLSCLDTRSSNIFTVIIAAMIKIGTIMMMRTSQLRQQSNKSSSLCECHSPAPKPHPFAHCSLHIAHCTLHSMNTGQ